ncbi:30S ribosomal protein S16 [bacterium]|nr:30S ribosomal protein S16 [bacterium]
MATMIRMTRMGSMKRPFYRLVVVDSRDRRDGRYIENLGFYDPMPAAMQLQLNEERILHWLGQGAQPSGTAESLMRRQGILEKFRLLRMGVSAEELPGKLAEWKAKQPRRGAATPSYAEKKAQKKSASKTAGESAGEATEA